MGPAVVVSSQHATEQTTSRHVGITENVRRPEPKPAAAGVPEEGAHFGCFRIVNSASSPTYRVP